MNKKKIIYLHGIGSGKDSSTSKLLKELLPQYNIISPEIPINPKEAKEFIYKLYTNEKPDLVIGTSLGGFYTLFLGGCFKILINPALFASSDIVHALGYGEHSFLCDRDNNEKTYIIDEEFIDELRRQEKLFSEFILDMETRHETYALFGDKDKMFSHYNEFNDMFFNTHAKLIDGEHRLTKENIINELIPLINQLLGE